jgi:hypothetical protein
MTSVDFEPGSAPGNASRLAGVGEGRNVGRPGTDERSRAGDNRLATVWGLERRTP